MHQRRLHGHFEYFLLACPPPLSISTHDKLQYRNDTIVHNLRYTMSITYTLAALDVPGRSTERAGPLRSNSYRWRLLPLSWSSSLRQLSMSVTCALWLWLALRSMLLILLMHNFADARFRAQEVGGELTTHSGHARSNQGFRGIEF